MGTRESVPFKELYRLYDVSIVLGAGIEANVASSDYAFFLDLRYAIGLVDNSFMTREGKRLLNEKYQRLFNFFEANDIDPATMGFGVDDGPSREPIHKFSTFSFTAGIRYYF